MTNETEDLAESRDLTYHGKNHGKDGHDKVIHPLLGGLHKGSDPNEPAVLGDVLVAQGSPTEFHRYGIVVPAAGLRNDFTVLPADTVPAWRPTVDTVNPVAITPGNAGAPGSQVIFARRDHEHDATAVASAAVVNALVAQEYSAALVSGQQLTSNSTVFQNITDMILPLAANQVWRFAMTLISLSTVAADFKFQFTVPAGAVLFFSTGGYTAGGVYIASQASIAAATTINLDGNGINIATEIYGTVICGGTAGNLQLQAAQQTATVETTDFVVARTNIWGRRVA